MRLSLGRLSLAGWLAVAAMLALSSPGVNAVRAQEAHVAPVVVAPAGPSCQQGELRTEARDHSELMALGRRIAASSPSSRERVVLLLPHPNERRPASGRHLRSRLAAEHAAELVLDLARSRPVGRAPELALSRAAAQRPIPRESADSSAPAGAGALPHTLLA
jgi:hypothetical protein